MKTVSSFPVPHPQRTATQAPAPRLLKKARAMEQESIADSASKKLFEDLAAAEEGHFDQFDRQADFVKRFGERYPALQSLQGGEGPAE